VESESEWLFVPAGSLDSDVTLKADASHRANWDYGLGEIPVMEGPP
jgi:hypothetical protein